MLLSFAKHLDSLLRVSDFKDFNTFVHMYMYIRNGTKCITFIRLCGSSILPFPFEFNCFMKPRLLKHAKCSYRFT